VNVPVQTPEDGTRDPSAMRRVLVDVLSGDRRRAIRWYAAVSMALIIAPLSTMARNRAFSPCGPWRCGMVRNGLLVQDRAGLPDASTK